MNGLMEIMAKTIENLVINPVSKVSTEASNRLVHMKTANAMPKNEGKMIVLTASDIEMSDFNLNPFIAFAGGFPKFLVQKKSIHLFHLIRTAQQSLHHMV